MVNFERLSGVALARSGIRGLLLLLLAAAGCGPPPREARVEFKGRASFGVPFADTRRVLEVCPVCGDPLPPGAGRCAGRRSGAEPCGISLKHAASAPCGFCSETGDCAVCALYEAAGRCRHCLGTGKLSGEACFNCGASGRCSACAGSSACDACEGSRRIALPWVPRAPAAKGMSAPAAAPLASPRPALAAPGETVSWSGAPEWTLFLLEEGRRQEVDRVSGEPARVTPRRPGFYRALAPGGSAVFDVLELTLPPGVQPGPGAPPVRIEPEPRSFSARWSGDPLKDPAVVVEIPGLPPRSVAVPVVVRVNSLKVVSAMTPVRSGTPAALRAEADPPLGPNAACEWRITEGARTTTVVSRGPVFEHVFSAAGLCRVEAAVGPTVSAPLTLPVYRVAVVDDLGRPVQEVRLLSLRPEAFQEGRLREEALLSAPERLRILVEDPAGEAPASLKILTRSPDEGVVQVPVEYALTGPPGRRISRPFVVLSDRDDAGREAMPEDGTLHAVARGRVEVLYRGLPAGGAPVGPMIVHEIPLRFIVAGPGLPTEETLTRALDTRVAQANAVWEPLGRRFRRAGLRHLGSAAQLLLIRGRAAGAESSGRPSRAGVRLDGRVWAAATPWREESGPMTPYATARALQLRLEGMGGGFKAEIFQKLFGGDPEAVLLRVLRADGAPASLEALGEAGDVAQSVRPLAADLSDGCEVAPDTRRMSLEEAAVLVGGKAGALDGLDVFVVGELRALAARPAFKVYPAGAGLPASITGSALVSWKVMDGSDRYPYALARVLGELLLPPGVKPGPEDTLFGDPISELPGIEARKRISPATALKISERGRALPERK